MEKRGGKKALYAYRTRFFRLFIDKGVAPLGNLTYAKDNKTWEVLGSIDIIPEQTVVAIDAQDRFNRTLIIRNPSRTFWLRCNSEGDRNTWYTASPYKFSMK